MSYKNLETTLSEGIVTIQISREAKLNALNGATLDEIKTVSYTHLTLPTNREV